MYYNLFCSYHHLYIKYNDLNQSSCLHMKPVLYETYKPGYHKK